MKLFTQFPYLLSPDANDGGASSTPPEDVASDSITTNEQPGAEPTPEQNDAAFDAAAQAAIDTVQAASSPDADKGKAAPGEDNLVTSTDEPKLDASGKPIVPAIDPNETPEQELERKAKEANVKLEADKLAKDAEKSDADSKLPFHDHPRWKEVTAERDTYKTQAEQYRTEYESAKPIVEAHRSVVDYCKTNGINDKAYQETLQIRALMNTDPAKALEQLEPIVQSLKAMAGRGIAQDLQQEVTDGLLTEARAKEITQARAQLHQREVSTQQSLAQQQQQVVDQMSTSVATWFNSKQVSDPAFKNKEVLLNGVFSTLVNQTPPKNPGEVTALLEKALSTVNEQIRAFQPAKPNIKPPLKSNASRGVPKEPESMDDYAAQLIEQLTS